MMHCLCINYNIILVDSNVFRTVVPAKSIRINGKQTMLYIIIMMIIY